MSAELEHSQFAEVSSNVHDVHTELIRAGSKMSRRNIRVRVGMSCCELSSDSSSKKAS